MNAEERIAQTPIQDLLREFVQHAREWGIKEATLDHIITPVFSDGHGDSLTPFSLFERAADEIDRLSADLKLAEEKLERIRELHYPYHIYDECDHEHKAGDPGVIDIDEIGLTCKKLYGICYACCHVEHMGQSEECADSHDHGPDKPICKTRAILDGAPAKEEA